jgi:hypothetical protein
MKSLLTTSIAALMASALWVGAANAAGIITNGTVTLGVDDYGQLNIPGVVASPVAGETDVGLRFNATGNEATSHGCLCEGWGVGIGETLAFGSANNDDGVFGLSLVSFVSDGLTATSIVDMGGLLSVTHVFTPSTSANLYSVLVTITNTSNAAIADLRYTRTFDWDVEPTIFDEFVTIGGSAAATSVLLAIDNGFVDSNPFAARPTLIGGTGDFTDIGDLDGDGYAEQDIGANFDFGFGALGIGQSFVFEIFYGAAATEIGAISALASVLAEVYSLGQSGCDAAGVGTACDGVNASNTFMFGFRGVGGEVVVPGIPIPAAVIFLMTALGALGGLKLRQKKLA